MFPFHDRVLVLSSEPLLQQNAKTSGKPGGKPVVDAVMKRAAQAKQKIQQSKTARGNKIAQARGLPQVQNTGKPKIVRLTAVKQQNNKPFVFRGNNRGQTQGRPQQAQSAVPRRRGRGGLRGGASGQRGGATGFRVVVSADPARAVGLRGRGQARSRGRGRGLGGGNQQVIPTAKISSEFNAVVDFFV
jgi:hypothetical protein